jgi:hypothetical protein
MLLGKSQKITSLFYELCRELRGSQLSASLRSRLERCDPMERREICSISMHFLPPLFLACKKCSAEIVDYLLTECFVDVEQRGLFVLDKDDSTHLVTPLWCAAVAGKAEVVEVLLSHRADINSVSDTGSTPVRFVCLIPPPS